jgi:two-component sensor histidine kinase
VRVQPENDAIAISVRDEGVGLPPGFDPAASKRLGTRLVNALSKQLGGELTRPRESLAPCFCLFRLFSDFCPGPSHCSQNFAMLLLF